jgi:hypothetical protein
MYNNYIYTTNKAYKEALKENDLFCKKYGIKMESVKIPNRTDQTEFKDSFHFLVTINGQSLQYSQGKAHQYFTGQYEISYSQLSELDKKRGRFKIYEPYKPMAKDVIYSLLADRTNGENFEDWCSNFGLDSDSIKALNLYLASQESEKKLNLMFDRETIKKLEEELEDY